ncbi:MAG: hypothetical protein ACRELB_14190 [Polyangiaceae bacterium]
MTSLTLASVVYTPDQITAALQLLVNLRLAVEAAEAATKAKLAAEEAQAPALLSLMAALVQYVKVTFSGSPDVLADFGLKPRKPTTPMTAEQKAAANAKREATREATRRSPAAGSTEASPVPSLSFTRANRPARAPRGAPALARSAARGR